MSAELENPTHVRVNLCRLFYHGRGFVLQQLCVLKARLWVGNWREPWRTNSGAAGEGRATRALWEKKTGQSADARPAGEHVHCWPAGEHAHCRPAGEHAHCCLVFTFLSFKLQTYFCKKPYRREGKVVAAWMIGRKGWIAPGLNS